MSGFFGEATGATVVELGLWIFVRGTAFVAVAWLASRVASRRGASIGHLAWGGLLFALLALPALDYAGVLSRWGPGVVPAEWWEAPLSLGSDGTTDLRVNAQGARSPMAPTPIAVDLPEWSPPVARGSEGPPWVRLLLVVWAAVALALLARLVGRMSSISLVTRRARPWPGAAAHASVESIRLELGIRRPVRLLEVPTLRVPACWGVWRPTVGLPPSSAEWAPGHLRAALLHELAHVRRWDYLTLFFGQLACALYWPNPAVWWATGRALAESELACDEAVLRHGTTKREYASLLVAAAREARLGGMRPRAALSMARGPDVRDRIRGVLQFRPGSRVSGAEALRLVGVAFGLLVAVALVGVESDRETRRGQALRYVEAGEPGVRAAAARELGDLKETGSVATLTRLLNDPAPEVRGAAAHALAETGSPLATLPLMRRLEDPDPRVREAVIVALGRTRDRRAFYDLEELTGSMDRRTRLAATWAIGEIKCEPAIARLSYLLLQSADPGMRVAAARGLSGAPAELVEAVLTEALDDIDSEVMAAATASLQLTS